MGCGAKIVDFVFSTDLEGTPFKFILGAGKARWRGSFL
jgi:hypothetical protein